MPANTNAGKNALEDLYDALKSYLTNERGPNCTELINESDITFYPKNKEELISVYRNALKKHTSDDPKTCDYDWWCSSDALPEWIDKANAPLDPCRIIMTGNSTKTQIEVPLSIYEEWMDEESIREGIDPQTGKPLQ